ncbi:MAG: B12-binding domain-containing radical SAM protein, partial [Desulfobaccales bacterium]
VDLNTRPLSPADWQWADLVMITGMIIQREGVLTLIRQARALGKTTVVGGPYVTSTPEEAQAAGANFVVRGEGETAIPHFLAALRQGEAGGVIQEDSKPDMSTSPVPRFDLLDLEDYVTMSIQTSRGCPFDCEFCDIVSLYGRKPRYKKPAQVIAELETLYRLGWRQVIFVSDDNFIGNKKHARDILAPLIVWMKSNGEPFGFYTQASVNLGHDLEMIDLLTAANFSHIFLGVETPEPEILSRNQKYQNLKEPLGPSLATIGANGLSMVASFIIGFDHEAAGAGNRICDFVEKYNIPAVMLNLLQAPPHTRLWERLKQEGRLLDLQTTGDSYGLALNFLPTRPAAEVIGEYVGAIDRLYEPAGYLARSYRYFLNMRPTRQALARRQGATLEATTASSKPGSPLRERAREWGVFLRLLWLQGIRPPYRGQFWRQLWGIFRRNPSRFRTYLLSCVMGENLFALRKEILRKWRRIDAVGNEPETASADLYSAVGGK